MNAKYKNKESCACEACINLISTAKCNINIENWKQQYSRDNNFKFEWIGFWKKPISLASTVNIKLGLILH